MDTTPDLSLAVWVTSSYSNGDGGNCVEWAPQGAASGVVPVRDSEVPAAPVPLIPAQGWSAFVGAVPGAGFRAA